MTVAIAIRANDGVVLATDSMASELSIASIHQKVRSCAQDRLIWAFAGDLSLAQAVQVDLENITPKEVNFEALTGIEIAQVLTHRVRRAINQALQGVRNDVNSQGLPSAEFLLAAVASDGPFTMTIHADLTAVVESEQQMTAIGVGKIAASALRQSLSHYLTEAHTVSHALPVAYRVVDTVCDVSAYAIAPPVQVATVTRSGAEILAPTELGSIQEQVQSWIALEVGTLYPTEKDQDSNEIPMLDTVEASP